MAFLNRESTFSQPARARDFFNSPVLGWICHHDSKKTKIFFKV